MIILPEIPQGRRTSPRRRQTDVVERILTITTLPEPTEEATPESTQHRKQPTHEHGMMHNQV